MGFHFNNFQMKAVIKELNKQRLAKLSVKRRVLQPIKAGEFTISIQGGEMHYSTPRKDLAVKEYSSMEISLWSDNEKVKISEALKDFPWYEELKNSSATPNINDGLFGWLPVGTINELYIFLNK